MGNRAKRTQRVTELANLKASGSLKVPCYLVRERRVWLPMSFSFRSASILCIASMIEIFYWVDQVYPIDLTEQLYVELQSFDSWIWLRLFAVLLKKCCREHSLFYRPFVNCSLDQFALVLIIQKCKLSAEKSIGFLLFPVRPTPGGGIRLTPARSWLEKFLLICYWKDPEIESRWSPFEEFEHSQPAE